jgi:ATP-dependent exoDNAse (exonuclease V) beta subunit
MVSCGRSIAAISLLWAILSKQFIVSAMPIPPLFLATKKEFEEGGGQVITLQDNFRSREEVISAVNALFSEAMSAGLGDVTYDASQALGYGNKALYSASSDPRYELETYCYDKLENKPIAESEARIIANDILEKLASGFPVMDKESKSPRPCQMGDFAILISRKKDFPLYQRLFSEAKLSLSVSNDQDLSSQDVTLLMESFLRLGLALDQDPAVEKHCYASIMRSYLYGEKDPEIYEDIQSGSYHHSPLFESIRADLPSLRKASSFEAVRYFLDHFPFYEKLELIGDVVDNYEKLSSFLATARSRDHLGGSYADFLTYFDDLKTYDETLSLPEPQDDGDSIKLMSIHASKGLEYPIVYCPDLGAGVNTKNMAPAFNFSFDHGFVFPLTLGEGSPYGVLQPLVYNDELRSTLSEKMRLYYVALTRAKEKIILLERKRPKLTVYRVDALHLLKVSKKLDKDGKPTMVSALVSPKSFHEFNDLATIFAFHRVDKKVPEQLTPYQRKGTSEPAFALPEHRDILIPSKLVAPHRASKESLEPVDEGALLRGDILHRYLEVADFVSKDVSYIQDPSDRSIIAKVLSLPLFQRTTDATFLPEDAFYDEEQGVHGAMDLLILYPEKTVVVDYKTKEIDDPAYPKQLAIYRHYVEKTYARPCSTYLLSILGGYLKEVK